MTPPLFLASTSPRRRELLEQLGLDFSVVRVDVDESRRPQEAAQGADGQADDVEVVALDGLDEPGARELDRVAARAAAPLPQRDEAALGGFRGR